MEGIQFSKIQCLSRHRRVTEPGKQGGGTSPSPGNNLVLFAYSVQLGGGKHHCRGSPGSLRGQLHTVQSFLCKVQYEKGGTVRTSSDSIPWESHSLSLPVPALPSPPQEQLQSAKSYQKVCITSGKLSMLPLWASPQGRTTGGRLLGKIGLLKWQFIVNHFSKLLIEALSVTEEGDLSFCPSRNLMTP